MLRNMGMEIDSLPCRTCVPGHALEALWFLISMFEQENDTSRVGECCRLIRRHIGLAWDNEYIKEEEK